MLILKFLGDIKIELNGVDITESLSNKSIALLAIILTNKENKMSRSKLLGFLWPESSEDAAKYNLRYNLWQLKKTIIPDERGKQFLIVTKDFCGINEEYAFSCDIVDIMTAKVEEDTEIGDLEKIYELFKGDFFENLYFTGCDEFVEMVLMHRYFLENKKLSLLKRLIKTYYEKKQWDKCLSALEACEFLDPYDEDNALKYLEILIREEHYTMAIKYYQNFYNKLTCDIGIEPSQEFKKLAEHLKNYRKPEKRGIVIKALSIYSVDCYLMADIVKKLINLPNFSIGEFLDSNQISDLASIQYRLGTSSRCPTMARTVDGFIELICGVCEKYEKLQIEIQGCKIDPISKDVIEHLKSIMGERLKVNILG